MPTWKLTNPSQNRLIEGLTTLEVKLFLKICSNQNSSVNLSVNLFQNLHEWYAWTESYVDWIPLKDCADFFEPATRAVPLPPTPPLLISAPVPSLALVEAPAEKRQHPRTNVKMKVVLIHGKKTFRSFVKNISLGGFLLDKKLPWTATDHEICDILLTHDQECIRFKARLMPSPSNPNRLAFAFQDELNQQSRTKLTAWLHQQIPTQITTKKAA